MVFGAVRFFILRFSAVKILLKLIIEPKLGANPSIITPSLFPLELINKLPNKARVDPFLIIIFWSSFNSKLIFFGNFTLLLIKISFSSGLKLLLTISPLTISVIDGKLLKFVGKNLSNTGLSNKNTLCDNWLIDWIFNVLQLLNQPINDSLVNYIPKEISFNRINLSNVSRIDILDYLSEELSAGAKPKSSARKISTFRQFFRFLLREKVIRVTLCE